MLNDKNNKASQRVNRRSRRYARRSRSLGYHSCTVSNVLFTDTVRMSA